MKYLTCCVLILFIFIRNTKAQSHQVINGDTVYIASIVEIDILDSVQFDSLLQITIDSSLKREKRLRLIEENIQESIERARGEHRVDSLKYYRRLSLKRLLRTYSGLTAIQDSMYIEDSPMRLRGGGVLIGKDSTATDSLRQIQRNYIDSVNQVFSIEYPIFKHRKIFKRYLYDLIDEQYSKTYYDVYEIKDELELNLNVPANLEGIIEEAIYEILEAK